MRINRLLRKKRLHDNLFFPLHPLSMNDDISKHAAFLYRGIFKRPYRNHSKDREFHGIAHASNVAIYISLLITLYSKYSECDLTNEDKKLLQLAALFHDAGREGDGKDLWDKDSAELLYHYLTTTLKVSHEKAVVFSEAIANKDYEPGNIYYHLVIEEGEISWKDEIAQKEKTLVQKILHDADCFDIIRVRSHFDKNYLDFQKTIAKFNENASIEIMQFSDAVKKLVDLEKADPAGFNTELCFNKILLEIQKNPSLSFLKNLYGAKTLDYEVSLIKTVHKHERHQSRGRLYKFIRQQHWNDFAKSLVDPENYRPGTDKYKDLRLPGQRKKFTARLNKIRYEAVSTNKSLRQSLHGDEKKKFTKHQSASFANDEAGYAPMIYLQEEYSVQVGVSFDPIDCIIQRIFVYIGGTYGRPYDFDTAKEAEDYIEKRLKEGTLHESLFSLQEQELKAGSKRANEVMAGFKWTTRSNITVFTDTIESRLLAQLRAQDLKNRLEAHSPGVTFDVPISIYPGFTVYDITEQEEDLKDAENIPALKKYISAIKILSGTSPDKFLNNIEYLPIAYALIHELNPEFCKTVKDRSYKILEDKGKAFFEVYKSDAALLLQWIAPEKLSELIGFLSVLKKIDFEKMNNEPTKRALFLFKEMDYFIENIKNNKPPAESIDTLEKLKIFLISNDNKLPNGFDIKKKFSELIKSEQDILAFIQFPGSHFFETELLMAVGKHEFSNSLKKMIIHSKSDINKLLVAAKGSIVLSIDDILSIIEERINHELSNVNASKEGFIKAQQITEAAVKICRSKIKLEYEKKIAGELFKNFKDFIKSPGDFIKFYSLMDDQLKINCISEFCEEIHGWVSSIEVFEGVCLQTNTPSFIREAFFNVLKLKIKNLIGNSAENFNRLFLILSDSEKKEAYRELPENWVLKNIASIEDFSIVGIHLDEDALKTLLDSDSISKKTALEFIMLLCEKKELKSTPALVSLVLSHQKTKTMIERTFRSGTITGDFIDLTHKNKACLSIVLASDYYKTEDGIRALNAALLRYRSDDETVQAIKDTLQKNQKQKMPETHNVSLDANFTPGQIYNAITSLFCDFAKINIAGQLKLNNRFQRNGVFYSENRRPFWIHSVLNDQGAEIGRLIISSNKDDNPRIIYYPGTLERNVEGIPLNEIKKFVDKKIQEACPDVNLSDAIFHYVVIKEKSKYIGGIAYEDSLDIQEMTDQENPAPISMSYYSKFQEATSCSHCTFTPYFLSQKEISQKRYQNLAVESHVRALGFSDSLDCVNTRGQLDDDEYNEEIDIKKSKFKSYEKSCHAKSTDTPDENNDASFNPEDVFHILIETELPKYPASTCMTANPISVSKSGIFVQATLSVAESTNREASADSASPDYENNAPNPPSFRHGASE